MRIASWNINSVRMRLPAVLEWLKAQNPDILMLQEIKCEADAFPTMEIRAAGYEVYVVGQKSYNGVAILSKKPLTDLRTALPGDDGDSQARYLEAMAGDMLVICLYLPNGNPMGTEKYTYKLAWMERLYQHLHTLMKTETPIIVGGDFNIIPEAIDVYDAKNWENDALYHPTSRAAWQKILGLGYTEAYRTLHPHNQAYTFWDYQAGAWPRDLGLRIDHFLLSPEGVDRLQSCTIDKTPRGAEKASDHTPIFIDLKALGNIISP